MDILATKWDNEDVKTPTIWRQITPSRSSTKRREAIEKQLNDLIPIPDKTNFLPLLKQALAENRPFAYKPSATGRTFYVPQDTVQTMIYVLEGIGPHYQDIFLDLLPTYMTTLGCKCLEMRYNKEKYGDWFKCLNAPHREYHQYEFELV